MEITGGHAGTVGDGPEAAPRTTRRPLLRTTTHKPSQVARERSRASTALICPADTVSHRLEITGGHAETAGGCAPNHAPPLTTHTNAALPNRPPLREA
ncbi:MAG: hypothetical protein LBD24_01800 [Spirochaetaceae bacterium]|nr:hypothetical protein [Spirochaetaceae bacterium]